MPSRAVCGFLFLFGGCTAIRPLDPGSDDAGRHDAASTATDASLDAFATADATTPDATMPDAFSPMDAANDAPASDAGQDASATVDAGSDAAALDANCRVYYPDVDRDSYGASAGAIMSCTAPPMGTWRDRGGDCDDTNRDVHPGRPESCNGLDDDCNGAIDDGGSTCGMGCTTRSFAGHAYLFCGATAARDTAAAACGAVGYHLADIGDAAEDAFVQAEAQSMGLGTGGGLGTGIWIGLMEMGTAPLFTYVWTDGSAATYTHWDLAAGEPNHNGPCVRIRTTTGFWADQLCSQALPYVCEAP